MALTLPPQGSGTSTPVVLTDLVGGSHAQQVKLLDGTAGSAFPILGTPNGELVQAERTHLFGDPLLSTLDTAFWTNTLANGGTVVFSPAGQMQLLTNTTANGSAIVQSVPRARLMPGTYNTWDCWVNLDSGVTNNLRQWGAYDANNGLFFRLSGTTLSVGTRRSGTDAVVAAASWSGLPGYALDTNWHRYTIQWGGMDAWWWIDGVLAHSIPGAGAANPLYDVLDHLSRLENTNSAGGTTSTRLAARSLSVWRLGHPLQRERSRHFSTATTNTTLKSGAGTLKRLILGNAQNAGTITLADAIGSTASGLLVVLGVATGTQAANPARTVELDLDFSTGLSITSTVTNDVTVLFD